MERDRLKSWVMGEQKIGAATRRNHEGMPSSPVAVERSVSKILTRSSAIAEGPRDATCQLKSCQLPRNSAETTYTTSPDQIDGMKLEI